VHEPYWEVRVAGLEGGGGDSRVCRSSSVESVRGDQQRVRTVGMASEARKVVVILEWGLV
jgi:hypothetical protein